MKKQKNIKLIVLTTIVSILVLVAIIGTYVVVQGTTVQGSEPFICKSPNGNIFKVSVDGKIEEVVTPKKLTLNSNGDSIFIDEYYETFGDRAGDPVINAKLVYESKEKTIIISNKRVDTLSSTSLILVEYYEKEELKKSFALRGKSMCFNDEGGIGMSSSCSGWAHYPKGWTDFRVATICSVNMSGHDVYGRIPEIEYPQFSGEWIIDIENSDNNGLKYFKNVLVEDERTEIKEPEKPEDYKENDVTEILTEGSTINGEIHSSTNPFIPAGFKAVNTYVSKWDETNNPDTENGLVIEDGNKNQFVWVPILNINEMAMCKTCGSSANSLNIKTAECTNCGENTILVGKLYNGETVIEYSDTGSREPVALTSAGETTEQQTEYENNYKTMIKSVAKYGGFYIGRYETSVDSEGKAQSKKSTEDNVLVSANASTNGSWIGLYNLQRTYVTDSVQGELIWGSQYDAMVRWLGTTTIGIYNATRNPGTQSRDVIKNIYDLYGNSYEWTQESYSTNIRPTRGGCYNKSTSSIAYRCSIGGTFSGNTATFEKNGSRMTLCITE